MAKASPTRRAPARTATPEELAEESERAQYERAQLAPSVPDQAIAAAMAEMTHYDDLGEKLRDGRWIPCTPAEVAAALPWLANDINAIFDVGCNSDPSLHSLREHVLALESLIVGRDVHFLAELDGDPADNLAGRAEFQRLYQRFDVQRRAGEDAGLHQRLAEAEARIARLENRMSKLS